MVHPDPTLTLFTRLEELLGAGRRVQTGLDEALGVIMRYFQANAVQLRYQNATHTQGNAQLALSPNSTALRAALNKPEPTLIIQPDILPNHLQAVWIIPLYHSRGASAMGSLQICAAHPNTWQQDNPQIALLVGMMLGNALENAIQLRLTERQQHQLQWLDDLSAGLANLLTTLEIDDVVTQIMESTRNLLNVEAASIMLLEPNGDDLILWRHTPPETDLKIRLKPGQGIAGWVLANARPACVNDVSQDPRWESRFDESTDFTTRSLLAVPVFLHGQTIGVLEAVNRQDEHFTPADTDLLGAIAKWAAVAIGNARTVAELQQTHERLSEAKKHTAVAHMVLNLAHRINNSVGAIRVWALDALDDPHLSTTQRQRFRDMLYNSEETLLLVRRMRSTTDLQTDQLGLVSVPDCLDAALLATDLKPGIRVERHYAEHVPPVQATKERLIEVFWNLIDNALQAMGPQGRLSLHIDAPSPDVVQIQVEDTGRGIPEHLKSVLFEPFVTDKEHGLGLGLWMVRLYVELLGGQITLQEPSEAGSRFCIRLPSARKETE